MNTKHKVVNKGGTLTLISSRVSDAQQRVLAFRGVVDDQRSVLALLEAVDEQQRVLDFRGVVDEQQNVLLC
jgi:hypothetical protein